MEHPCYRCQASIEEGIAFCPHCGAPQIRVVAPEDSDSALPAPTPSDQPFPPDQPIPQTPAWTQPSQGYPPGSAPIHWELAWKGALLAGLGAAVLSAVPVVSLGCCLWLLGAGALSVALYQRKLPGVPVTPGDGMKLGALAGFFGSIINAVVTTARFVAVRENGDFNRALQEQMQKATAANPDPKVQEMVERMMNWIGSPGGMATFMVIILAIMVVFFIVFTAAGGALGASMFGRRREFR